MPALAPSAALRRESNERGGLALSGTSRALRALILAFLLTPHAARASEEALDIGSRLGPTFNFGLFGIPVTGTPPPLVGASSLRGGLRFALLPRSASNYAMNLSASFQVGLEGIRREHAGPLYAVGLTGKVGVVGITQGGPFMPFADLYLFFTVAMRNVNGATVALPRAGVGLNGNVLTAVPDSWKPGLSFWWSDRYILAFFPFTLTNVELVFTPSSAINPAFTTEVRAGFGF